MCGLVGIVGVNGTIDSQLMTLFGSLLYHDTVRGPQSTGMMWYYDKPKKKRPTVVYTKAAMSGPEFLKSKKYLEVVEEVGNRNKKGGREIRAIFGHNRWATFGEVSDDHAHPFSVGNILCMHNGTLQHADWDRTLKDKFKVDSHALTHMMNEDGAKETLGMMYGSYALMWFDMKHRQACIARNAQRPMAVARIAHGGKTYDVYASEVEMLDWILGRSRIFGKKMDKQGAYEIAPDAMVKYSMASYKQLENEKIPRIYRPAPQPTYHRGGYLDGSSVIIPGGYVREEDKRLELGGTAAEYVLHGDSRWFSPTKWEPYPHSEGKKGKVFGNIYRNSDGKLVDIDVHLHTISKDVGEAWCSQYAILEVKINSWYGDPTHTLTVFDPETDHNMTLDMHELILIDKATKKPPGWSDPTVKKPTGTTLIGRSSSNIYSITGRTTAGFEDTSEWIDQMQIANCLSCGEWDEIDHGTVENGQFICYFCLDSKTEPTMH